MSLLERLVQWFCNNMHLKHHGIRFTFARIQNKPVSLQNGFHSHSSLFSFKQQRSLAVTLSTLISCIILCILPHHSFPTVVSSWSSLHIMDEKQRWCRCSLQKEELEEKIRHAFCIPVFSSDSDLRIVCWLKTTPCGITFKMHTMHSYTWRKRHVSPDYEYHERQI